MVIDANAPVVQVKESQRAFYAGAASMLTAIMGDLDPGLEPTPKDLDRMDALVAEIRAFNVEVNAGRA
jgi:hypothetical protein